MYKLNEYTFTFVYTDNYLPLNFRLHQLIVIFFNLVSYIGIRTELQQRIYNECCEKVFNDQKDSTQNNDAENLPHLRKFHPGESVDSRIGLFRDWFRRT